ncbi:hypothetical protein EJ05DRAFT_502246 [Pseudovirgaria hyperparasitica]|uniref:Transcriptional regulatory protein DEP1 n=1 Tax=Pseudovirgaria hyperparasitica TaxID=470096 RepID=A0A6A6W2F4_9PEZI|nr:uncharacterized protein EJ05DRAFT_502246 [Pseudovirgaria hyperparasitica]KAF2756753.1 hypothetical protein EJ05DRAFT_502246 [Pseudovirgaria hyperparasitica]
MSELAVPIPVSANMPRSDRQASTSPDLPDTQSPPDHTMNITTSLDIRSDADTSSLSDFAEGSEDHEDPVPFSSTASNVEENDSEAETERLENTPRKPLATGLYIANVGTNLSRLSTPTPMETRSPPESPITPVEETKVPTLDDKGGDEHALGVQQSLATISEAAPMVDNSSRKRKRSTPEDQKRPATGSDEPAPKRSGSFRADLNGNKSHIMNTFADVEVPDDTGEHEHTTRPTEDPEVELGEDTTETAEEVAETATRLPRSRKGKRKGKKIVETTEKEPPLDSGDIPDVEDADNGEEEDDAALDEELAKKKDAMDKLSSIREKFIVFREKVLEEQLNNVNLEIESLEAAEPTHTDFLAMLKCIDERRDEKIAHENKLLSYKVKTLKRTTIAERHQIQSQYFQSVRDIKDRSMEACQKRLNQLQKERRRVGTEEVDYALLFNPKRSDQIRHQTAINREVSILAGVAKYRGFPAAPDVTVARDSEVDDDLKAMNIQKDPVTQTAMNAYPAIVSNTMRAGNQVADESFLQRNPWANPQHPAHQLQANIATSSHPRFNPLVTPASQKRTVDITAPNGSVSTIEAASNPPSSAAGPGQNGSEPVRARKNESSSPILPFKRPSNHETPRMTPSASRAYSNNSSPVPNNWKNSHKDSTVEYSYASPMTNKGTDNQRTFGLANAAASAMAAGHEHPLGGSSRNKTPMGQRSSGLSVGTAGNSAFGR